jgi:regulatory helix-turn-helix AraC family protein
MRSQNTRSGGEGLERSCKGAAAGFADQAHFTRVFKSAFGLTPAGYRALRIGPVDLTGRRAAH